MRALVSYKIEQNWGGIVKRTLIILGILVAGILIGIFLANRSGEQKPWPQEEIWYFELLVSSDGEKSPAIGWNNGEGGVMFLHDVELSYLDWNITFALYDRECLLGDPRKVFMTDPDRFTVCETKETRTAHWDFFRSEIIELWGEQWQILRVIDHSRLLDDGRSWETEYLVIMRWIH